MTTITFEDLMKLEKAATSAAVPQTAGINEFIPKNLTDSIANAINKFAENPEKFVNSLQKLAATQQQQQQPQAVPLQQLAPPATQPPATEQQPTAANFDNFYEKMTEGLEDVLNTAGDLSLSKIIEILKTNPDGCKTMLKPYFEEWAK
jgi:hypothetical protein